MNALRSIVRALRVNSRAVERQLGLTLAQPSVLKQLAERPVKSLNELAFRTMTHQSSVSVVVSRLLTRGLVTRTVSSVDKRRAHIAITPTGAALLERAPPTVEEDLLAGMMKMPPEERALLAQLFEAWTLLSGMGGKAESLVFEESPLEDALDDARTRSRAE